MAASKVMVIIKYRFHTPNNNVTTRAPLRNTKRSNQLNVNTMIVAFIGHDTHSGFCGCPAPHW